MSTARRIQLGILGIVFVVFLVCGAAVLQAVRADLVGQIDDQLVSATEALARLSTDGDGLDVLDRISEQPSRESAVLVFDDAGDVLLSIPAGQGDDDEPLPDIGRVGVDELRDRPNDAIPLPAVTGSADYRVVAAPYGENLLVIASPLDDVRATMRRLTATLLGSAVFMVVAIGLGTSFVIRRAISPIDDMIDTAAAIGRGELDRRIDTTSHDPEVLRLSGALNEMMDRLGDAMQRKDASEERLRRFVADASHELRTPLASIRGYSELVLGGAATDSADVERAMTRVRSEAVRTGALVDELLLLARLDQGGESLDGDADLASIVREAVDDARVIEPDRSIGVTAPDGAVVVPGSADRLRQVVVNLLANTRAHAPGAAVRVTLTVGDAAAMLVVADDGPGLDDAVAARVFDRFWRADEVRNRRTGGSGLGLAIAHAIVVAHGGTIDVVSDGGAVFTVRLPRGPAGE